MGEYNRMEDQNQVSEQKFIWGPTVFKMVGTELSHLISQNPNWAF